MRGFFCHEGGEKISPRVFAVLRVTSDDFAAENVFEREGWSAE